MNFLLIFDIPATQNNFKKKINKILHEIGAEMVQRSIWRSDNLKELMRLAILIMNIGGKAMILEEKVVFPT